MLAFASAIDQRLPMLVEGSIIERLQRGGKVTLHPRVKHAGLIYSEDGRAALEKVYGSYIEVALKFSLPLLTFAPTRRASRAALEEAGFSDRDVNVDAVRFMKQLAARKGALHLPVFIGGMMGCAYDAYKPETALSRQDAYAYHHDQATAFKRSEANLIMISTLPALSEALGIGDAVSESGLPFLMSFVIRENGCLLDSTPLGEAIQTIDSSLPVRPAGYGINCVHPDFIDKALALQEKHYPQILKRIVSVQGNTARLTPEELEGSVTLITEEAGPFAAKTLSLQERFGIPCLGGCCGTDERHLEAIARGLATKRLN